MNNEDFKIIKANLKIVCDAFGGFHNDRTIIGINKIPNGYEDIFKSINNKNDCIKFLTKNASEKWEDVCESGDLDMIVNKIKNCKYIISYGEFLDNSELTEIFTIEQLQYICNPNNDTYVYINGKA